MVSTNEIARALRYEPETGVLSWKVGRLQGRAAGCLLPSGYRMIQIQGEKLLAHRVAFAIATGVMPADHIDHINGVKDDNRLVNLRCVAKSVNLRNCKLNKRSKTGLPGVYWARKAGRWIAFISTDNGRLHLGTHTTIFSAACARKSAELKHGYHANHGRG